MNAASVRNREMLIIAGEHSGDLLGGDLVKALRRSGHTKFVGTGGPMMEAAGVELIETVESLEVIGFVEALGAYSRLKRLAHHLAKLAVDRGIKTAVLIDYPGFNLYLANLLKKAGLKVIYLVSPQIWAWRYGRIKKIRRNVDLMLTLFPFENELYQSEGVRSEFIGHPLAERIARQLKTQKKIPPKRGARPTIGILPGSRGGEISALLPVMLKAASSIREYYPQARFLLPGVNRKREELIETILSQHPEVEVELYWDSSLAVMDAADVLMVASGTVTLEATLLKKPMVILYRISLLNYLIGSIVTRVRYIGLPNILARQQVAVELLQAEVNPENISREIRRILSDSRYRISIVNELEQIRKQLDQGQPIEKAARFINRFLKEK